MAIYKTWIVPSGPWVYLHSENKPNNSDDAVVYTSGGRDHTVPHGTGWRVFNEALPEGAIMGHFDKNPPPPSR
jgi:hypothetical protein